MTPSDFVNSETLTFQPGQLIVVSGPDNATIISMLIDAENMLLTNGIDCLDPLDTRMTVFYPEGLVLTGTVPTTTQFKTHSYVKIFERLNNGQPAVKITIVSGANIGQTRGVLEYDRVSGLMTLDSSLPFAPAVGDGFSIFPTEERALKFEYYAVTYQATGPTPKVILISNQFDREDPEQNPFPADLEIDTVRDLLNLTNVANVPYSFNFGNGEIRELFAYISKVYYYDTRSGEITFVKNQIPERP